MNVATFTPYCHICDSEDCRCSVETLVAAATSAQPHLPRETPVVSEVGNGRTSLTTLSVATGTRGSPFVEMGGDELAGTEIEELETLPLLGRPGYIGVGTSTLLSAYPKVGKTTLLKEMLRDWAGLGHRILVFTEEPDIAWRLRFRDEAKDLWQRVRFVFAMNIEPRVLLERMVSGDEKTVVVDTARAVFGIKDENDNAEVNRKVSPWIAQSRATNKTLLVQHHGNKAGGEHGRGISGGHALFALFDAALEIERVQGSPNRRLIRGYARLLIPNDLIYERQEEGSLVALGDALDIQRDEVRRRIKAALTSEYMTRKEILESVAEPKPSYEMARLVLDDLVSEGAAERDPMEDRRGATYRWRQPHLPDPPSIGGTRGSRPTQEEEHGK